MKTIAFLTSYGGQLFNPESSIDSMPGVFGSELALFETCRRLSIFYNIVVFISKPSGYIFDKWNIKWKSSFDWDKFDIIPEYVVICRYMNIFLDYTINPKSKILVWAHDPYFLPQWNGTYINDALMKNVEPFIYRWICVGDAQFKEKLAPRYNLELNKYTVIRNGITLESYIPKERKPLSFVWCSCPTRGLWFLLDKWNLIKQHFPTATLTIYYTKSQESIQQFQKYAWDTSINYVGKVSQQILFDKLKETEYWLYCSSFESCCTTAIEMAYYGPIAITAPQGGLKENVVTEGLIWEENLDKWYDKAIQLIHKLEDDPNLKAEFRKKQYDWSLQQTWDHRIPLWNEIFK